MSCVKAEGAFDEIVRIFRSYGLRMAGKVLMSSCRGYLSIHVQRLMVSFSSTVKLLTRSQKKKKVVEGAIFWLEKNCVKILRGAFGRREILVEETQHNRQFFFGTPCEYC